MQLQSTEQQLHTRYQRSCMQPAAIHAHTHSSQTRKNHSTVVTEVGCHMCDLGIICLILTHNLWGVVQMCKKRNKKKLCRSPWKEILITFFKACQIKTMQTLIKTSTSLPVLSNQGQKISALLKSSNQPRRH